MDKFITFLLCHNWVTRACDDTIKRQKPDFKFARGATIRLPNLRDPEGCGSKLR